MGKNIKINKTMDADTIHFFSTVNALFEKLDCSFKCNYFQDIMQLFMLYHGLKPGVLLNSTDFFPDLEKVQRDFIKPLNKLLKEDYIINITHSEHEYYDEI